MDDQIPTIGMIEYFIGARMDFLAWYSGPGSAEAAMRRVEATAIRREKGYWSGIDYYRAAIALRRAVGLDSRSNPRG